jgi:redox-sensitive bicupin YhaK (pirin superfamily)
MNTRKDFLKKIILGITSIGIPAILFKLFGQSNKSDYKNTEQGITMSKQIIKSISRMGFQWETLDPFLFCVHHEDFYPKGNASMGPDKSKLAGRNIGQDFQVKDGWRMYHGENIPGFPNHPHRGFETVTVVRSGFVDHSDSMGAVGRYSAGDVQWMTAGAGVQHAEMFPLVNEDKDNKLELFQIWLNLPKANKFVKPHFTMLWNESIPKYKTKDENGKNIEVDIIAGKLGGLQPPPPPPDSWASDPKNGIAIWVIKMDAGAKWILPAGISGVNRSLYFYKGSKVKVADTEISSYHSMVLISDEDALIQNGEEEARFLLLQARPISEPVVQYGPFVMNTPEEIQAAFRDFQMTQFGGWSWNSSEPVHPRGKGRFAKHSDGREDLPKST